MLSLTCFYNSICREFCIFAKKTKEKSFEKYSENGEMNLAKVIEEIRNMNNQVEYERVSLSKTVQIDNITLI